MENITTNFTENQEVRINLGTLKYPSWKLGTIKKIFIETVTVIVSLTTQQKLIEKDRSELGVSIKSWG